MRKTRRNQLWLGLLLSVSLLPSFGCGDAVAGPGGSGSGGSTGGQPGTGGIEGDGGVDGTGGRIDNTGGASGAGGSAGGVGSGPSPCTDGVDCFCDRLNDPGDAFYDPNVLMCEDFEDPALRNGSNWMDAYAPATNGCRDAAGVTNIGNGSDDCFDIVSESAEMMSEGGCGVSDERDCVLDGNRAMGHRLRPNEAGGIVGTKSWSATRTFGATMAVKWSTNYKAVGTPGSGPAHKMNQFGMGGTKFAQFGNSGSSAGVNPPFTGSLVSRIPTTYDVLAGRAATSVDGLSRFYFGPDPNVYDWDRRPGDGPGNWECLRVHFKDWGTSDATFRLWMNGQLATHVTNIDMSATEGIPNRMWWNHFYNGADGRRSGYPGSSVAYRYEDNFVITAADEPVPCAALGF